MLVWALVEYVRWYFLTQQMIKAAGSEGRPSVAPLAFGMGGATGYDAVVLLLTTVLLFWHIKTFLAAAVKPT